MKNPPELLAPAGDRTCLMAAIENGADAVYFGLHGHNARARAHNFDLDELPEIIRLLHQRGVKGYVTLNTLVFSRELEGIERIIRRVAEAGADAVIVQDLGLCRLIRAITSDLEIHASTQMTVTSLAGVRLAAELGCSRVILARELSLSEMGRILPASPLPLEVFVHGALCVAYSGQCLTSEALGGRSANRGECAQACRMPYEILRDGQLVDLADTRYLLSPQDLAAFDLVPRLVELGIASLKIEGRLKSPEYVANITRNYRRAIDEAVAGRAARFDRESVQEMELSFSRGFSHGFLDGNNHKVLVRGDYAKKRGLYLGRVEAVRGDHVLLSPAAPIKPGDGLVFDGNEEQGIPEQGGRVYEVMPARPAGTHERRVALAFGHRDIDVRRIHPGQKVWKTDDPELTRRLRASFTGPPQRKVALDVTIRALAGSPLVLEGRTATGHAVSVASDSPLIPAERHPATAPDLFEQLDRLGGTVYALRGREAVIEGGPLVPRSLLNALRRTLVERLEALSARGSERRLAPEPVLPSLRDEVVAGRGSDSIGERQPQLVALCRAEQQALAAIRAGIRTIYLEYQDIKLYRDSLTRLRETPGLSLWLATPRIEKPGESNLFRFLAMQGADGLVVRNAGGLSHCVENKIPFVADFAFNAANELTVDLLRRRGAVRVTASYDLSFEQLDDLLKSVRGDAVEVVIHQHMPMFHMEHCVFCAFLSPGTDATNCGRPCDHHEVKLRDRVGMEHPLKADVGCRNTLFNAVSQTAAEFLPSLIERGARFLRVEFLDDSPEAVTRTLGLYLETLAGDRDGRLLWKELKAINRYGVTRGQLAVL